MKKLFATLCVLSFVGITAAQAAQTTYTEKFIQSKTAGIVAKEKELQAKHQANQKALEAKKQEAKKKQEANKKALEAYNIRRHWRGARLCRLCGCDELASEAQRSGGIMRFRGTYCGNHTRHLA